MRVMFAPTGLELPVSPGARNKRKSYCENTKKHGSWVSTTRSQLSNKCQVFYFHRRNLTVQSLKKQIPVCQDQNEGLTALVGAVKLETDDLLLELQE